MITLERKARINIDHRLEQAGAVQDPDAVCRIRTP